MNFDKLVPSIRNGRVELAFLTAHATPAPSGDLAIDTRYAMTLAALLLTGKVPISNRDTLWKEVRTRATAAGTQLLQQFTASVEFVDVPTLQRLVGVLHTLPVPRSADETTLLRRLMALGIVLENAPERAHVIPRAMELLLPVASALTHARFLRLRGQYQGAYKHFVAADEAGEPLTEIDRVFMNMIKFYTDLPQMPPAHPIGISSSSSSSSPTSLSDALMWGGVAPSSVVHFS